MRPAFIRPAVLALALAMAAPAAPARAERGDRLDVAFTAAKGAQRLHAIGADTLGLSYGDSYSGAVAVDFRVLDLPVGKSAFKPSLHLTGGVGTDELVLGPAVEGQTCGEYQLIEFAAGVAMELPLEAVLRGNAGVGVRLGWDGSYLLTRTGGQHFLERSRARLDFVRTSGGLQGSYIGVGMGRDETYGWDASGGRWNVRLSLQGRLCGAPGVVAAAPPVKGAAKTSVAARPAADGRLLWLFADVDVDTDGGPGADGLHARAGVGCDVNALVTAVFTPLRP